MRIGYVMLPERGATNETLSDVAHMLETRGLTLSGAVQTDTDCERGGKCDMDLRMLPGGQEIRISQNLGMNSKGCRLDPEALETAVDLTEKALAKADLVIINKFGKHEAQGRGFRNTIAAALEHDKPVLLGVSRTNFEAFETFTDGVAENAGNSVEDVLNWVDATFSI